ncbi:MAG: hypothetical protein QHJ73_13330 [Armatimonadota bacterium]|nr:hypothetical protein [Armatimonadota bacterium]
MAEMEPDGEPRDRRLSASLLAAVGAVATLGGAFAISRRRRRAQLAAHEAALRELAAELNAEFEPSVPGPSGPDFPRMTAVQRGRRVVVDTEVAGATTGYRLLTRATAEHKARISGFVVVREETALTRVADALGLADVQVGEAAFDNRFEVTSDLPDAANLLQPEVRDTLLAARFESVVIRQDEVTVRQLGPLTEVEELRQLMKLAVDVAEWLETLNGGTA